MSTISNNPKRGEIWDIDLAPTRGHEINKVIVPITPLTSEELENASKEFFAEEFRSSRLGTFGHWFGRGAEKLMAENPVTLTQFQNLARGLTPDGAEQTLPEDAEKKRISGWQIKFDGSQSLSVLWALAPEEYRTKIEGAHLTAVWYSIRALESSLDPAGLLSVLFDAGASQDQCPHRCATLFVFKQAVCGKAPPHTYVGIDIERHKAELTYHYEGAYDYHLWKSIGPFERHPGSEELRIVGVPQEIVMKFFYSHTFAGDLNSGERTRISEDLLFSKWRSQAERWGWGPKEAETLLKYLHAEKQLQDMKEIFTDNLRRNKANFERRWNWLKSAFLGTRQQAPAPEREESKTQERSRR